MDQITPFTVNVDIDKLFHDNGIFITRRNDGWYNVIFGTSRNASSGQRHAVALHNRVTLIEAAISEIMHFDHSFESLLEWSNVSTDEELDQGVFRWKDQFGNERRDGDMTSDEMFAAAILFYRTDGQDCYLFLSGEEDEKFLAEADRLYVGDAARRLIGVNDKD